MNAYSTSSRAERLYKNKFVVWIASMVLFFELANCLGDIIFVARIPFPCQCSQESPETWNLVVCCSLDNFVTRKKANTPWTRPCSYCFVLLQHLYYAPMRLLIVQYEKRCFFYALQTQVNEQRIYNYESVIHSFGGTLKSEGKRKDDKNVCFFCAKAYSSFLEHRRWTFHYYCPSLCHLCQIHALQATRKQQDVFDEFSCFQCAHEYDLG